MKKSIYLFISILIIGIMSCKKENQNDVILVKTINDGFNIDSFFYDDQNRIVKYINSIETSEYTYYTDSVVENRIANNSSYSFRIVFTFNTFNQFIQYIQYSRFNSVYDKRDINYYGDGKVFSIKHLNFDIDSFYYTNGNATKMVAVTNSSMPTSKTVYIKTFSDKENLLSNSAFGMSFIPFSYFAKDYYNQTEATDKNLVQKLVRQSSTGTVLQEFNYSYEYDAKGRISKRVTDYVGHAPIIHEYTYY